MSTQTAGSAPAFRLIDRILAYGALVLVLTSIGCFIAIMIGTAQGMTQDDFLDGAWIWVISYMPLGLIIGFALIILLLVMTFIRKGRAAKR